MVITMTNGLSQHQLITLKNKIIQQQDAVYQLNKEGLFSHSNQNKKYAATAGNSNQNTNRRIINVNIKPKKHYFNTLLEMDKALNKIESNTYGACVKCKKNIGFERLSRYPSSRRCLRCESGVESIDQIRI